jgi:hypothetical protein
VPLVSPETSRPQLTEGLERREEEKYQKRHSTTLLYLLSSPSGGKLKEEQEEEEEEEGGGTDGRTDGPSTAATNIPGLFVGMPSSHTHKKEKPFFLFYFSSSSSSLFMLQESLSLSKPCGLRLIRDWGSHLVRYSISPFPPSSSTQLPLMSRKRERERERWY